MGVPLVERPAADLATVFVRLAEAMSRGDAVAHGAALLAHECVAASGARAVGVLLAGEHGRLGVVAATSDPARLLEAAQVTLAEGPAYACYRACAPVTGDAHDARWPRFGPRMREHDLAAVHAIPLRRDDRCLGVVDLYRDSGTQPVTGLPVVLALADVAAIAMSQHSHVLNARLAAEHLQSALDSRVVIEQAKGIVEERHRCGMEEAFGRLRRYARDHNLPLHDVAAHVVDRSLPL